MPSFTADFVLTPQGLQPNCLLRFADSGELLALERNVTDIPEDVVSLSGVLTPGFVNAHCHLELSHLEGQIPRGTGLASFAQTLVKIRNEVSLEARQKAMEKAEKRMKDSGIVAIGDISNTDESFGCKSESELRYHTFVELIGLRPEKAEMILEQGKSLLAKVPLPNQHTAGFSPHAPYSVSPELFSRIMEHEGKHSGISAFHNQESMEEDEFLKLGTGPFTGLYANLGLDLSWWHPPGEESLKVFYPLVKNGVRMLFVHNTFTSAELAKETLRLHPDPFFCICLKANLYIEQAMPDLPGLMEAEVRICLGTDSLASNDTLSIFEEMRIIQQYFPQVSTEMLLEWATLNGAMALNFQRDLGSFIRGKKPGLNLISSLEPGTFRFTVNSTVKSVI